MFWNILKYFGKLWNILIKFTFDWGKRSGIILVCVCASDFAGLLRNVACMSQKLIAMKGLTKKKRNKLYWINNCKLRDLHIPFIIINVIQCSCFLSTCYISDNFSVFWPFEKAEAALNPWHWALEDLKRHFQILGDIFWTSKDGKWPNRRHFGT